MPRKITDLTGKKFGKLKVVKLVPKSSRHTYYLCKCDCGEVKEVRGTHLTSGNVKSCGCYRVSSAVERNSGVFVNLLGKKYGRWTVIGREKNDKWRRTIWLCRCTCGTEKAVPGTELKRGTSTSCGCWQAENASLQATKRFTKHGMFGTPTYKSWRAMINRNRESIKYSKISICKRWLDADKGFENFYNDMGERPEGCTLDRIVNSKGYYKQNCRWATYIEQANNTERNRNFEGFGKVQTLTQWAREFNMKTGTLRRRLVDLGWTLEEAVTKPIKGGSI